MLAKLAATLAKKLLGFRYLMEVSPLDATLVRGSHGRVTDRPEDGPLLMTTASGLLSDDGFDAGEVHDLLLRHLFDE